MSHNFVERNRLSLSPKESVNTLVKSALFQDALKRKRTFRNLRASLIVKLMIFLPPAYYCASGVLSGCWSELANGWNFDILLRPFETPFRARYRPEIYLRDKQEHLYKIEKENIALEKAGEKPTITSPLVLWH